MKRASAALLAIGILNSLAGYLREIVVAAHFGAGSATDAFFSSYAFVLTFNDLLVAASLSAALIPTLERYRRQAQAGKTLVSSMAAMVLVVTVPCAAMLDLALPWIIPRLVPGLGDAEVTAAIDHGRWLVWLIPVYGLFFLSTLTLNAERRFVAPALGWLGINLVFMLVVLVLAEPLGPQALLLGAMSGPIVVTAALLALVGRLGLLGLGAIRLGGEPLRYAGRLARPILFTLGIGSSLGLLMVSHLTIRAWGSHIGPGGVSALTYAFRIYEVPLTLVAHVAGTLVLPVVVRWHEDGEWERIAELSRSLLFWGAALLVPTTMFFHFEAQTIVQLLLERRNFSADDAALTAQALQGFAWAIPFEAVFVVFYRIFYALHRPTVPVVTSFITLVTLALTLQVITPDMGMVWIAASLAVAFLAATVLSLSAMHRLAGGRILPHPRPALALLALSLLMGPTWAQASHASGLGPALLRGVGLTSLFWAMLLFLLPCERSRLRALLSIGNRQAA